MLFKDSHPEVQSLINACLRAERTYLMMEIQREFTTDASIRLWAMNPKGYLALTKRVLKLFAAREEK